MSRYDRAITVFSPEGQLLQVQYALEAVKKGSPVVGIKGQSCVVLGVEKRSVPLLQEDRTEKKIVALDDHVALAFAGLRADARVLISRAQIECQSYRLAVEDSVTVEYISKYIAGIKQQYTQSNGRRPFGISCIIAGYDSDETPRLYQTDPSGIFYEWKAASTGRADHKVREYLEKHYKGSTIATERGTVKLAIQSLMEVVHSGPRNIEVGVLKNGAPMKILSTDIINYFANEIENERDEKSKGKV